MCDWRCVVKRSRAFGVAVPVIFVLVSIATGSTLRVPDDYATIQEAIDAALNGYTVLVAPGEYDICEPIKFQGKAITVQSEAGRQETTIRARFSTSTPSSDSRTATRGPTRRRPRAVDVDVDVGTKNGAGSSWLPAPFREDPTVVLLSHRGSSAVPSPKRGLTSVFGMGTGVAPALWTVGKPSDPTNRLRSQTAGRRVAANRSSSICIESVDR